MIDLRYVKKLIEMIDDSSVDSIEISTEKGIKIRIAKNPAAPPAAAAVTVPVAHVAPASRPTPAAGAAAIEVTDRAGRGSPYLEVKSPMVGTFYGAPEPGAKPYVSIGDRVQKGQTLCIIEAMKIMNEIEAEIAGVVREV